MQDHCVRRIGGSREIPIQARIITATNGNLEKMVEEGTFRQDLYYRINVLPIHIPPLQERLGDIGLLAEHFLFTLASRMGRPAKSITPEGLAKLRSHHWPGNVRELKNVVDRAAILCTEDVIDERFIILAHELGDRIPGQLLPSPKSEPANRSRARWTGWKRRSSNPRSNAPRVCARRRCPWACPTPPS
jgi:Transcriptional regulator containing PAS, AAA-type ATPase, and DNA-binding domains